MKRKNVKTLKKIMIICIIIILIELLIMLIMKIGRERNIDRINALNDIIKVNNGYIAVGVSDFHDSKFVNEKTYQFSNSQDNIKQNIITTQSRIAKYDNNMNLLWENTYDNIYDSTFNSVIEVSDGYIVVGSYVSKYSQIEANTRDALIVKYDLDGKKVWEDTYTVLSDTEFYKIIKDDDNYVVIGQSIYENMEMGNHITGGGIIVRYNKDGQMIAHNNYGGNKSGNFNDIIKVDDGYIVCGKDATNYGIVVKFKKDFNREENDYNLITKKVMWQRTYSNTDTFGFTSLSIVNDKIYAVGALNVSNDKDDKGNILFKYNAGMVIYNTSGKFIGKKILNEDVHNRFTSLVKDDNYLYLSMLLDIDNTDKKDSALIKYDLSNEKFINRYNFNSNNNLLINKIIDIDNKHMYIGTANNNCTIRGCDYENLVGYYEDLKIK